MHSSVHQTEGLLFGVLLQLIVMIAAARAGNLLLRRFGQPGVIGEILAGLLLGPSLFGHFFPDALLFLFGAKASTPITIISQIGLVLLMFQIGTDFEFGHLSQRKNRNGTIGFDLGFIPQNVFTMLVIMAVTTTVMTGPLLRVLLPRAGYAVPVGVEA